MTPNPNPGPVHPTPDAPLVSEFAADPDMHELIGMFVDEMPERIRTLEQLAAAGDFESLKRLAHQLKGASGGYGFPTVGNAAGQLEQSLKALLAAGSNQGTSDRLAAIRSEVESLVELCQRCRAAG